MAHSITPRQYDQLKKLMRIARQEQQGYYRTKTLICELLPQVVGLGLAVDQGVDGNVSARELCRRLQVKIKQPGKASRR